MSNNIGINLIEVDGAGAPAIVGAPTSVAGFNILTRRGVPNRATRVNSYTEFAKRFGGHFSGGLGAYLVKGFFDNGGRTAWINRVAGASTAAQASINDLDAAATLRLRGGYRGLEDPGTWGNALYYSIAANDSTSTRLQETAPASVTAQQALADQTDLSGGATLSVIVDGESAATQIQLVAGDFPNPTQATREQIRDAINGKTTKLTASITNANELQLTSSGITAAVNGEFSQIEVTAAAATLGITAAIAAVSGTPANVTARQTTLRNADGFAPGDAVRFRNGNTTANVKLIRVVENTGEIEWAADLANPAGFQSPDTTVERIAFDLTIAQGGKEEEHIVETHTDLSMESDAPNFVEDVLNDEVRGSEYVTATDLESASAVGQNVPAATTGFEPLENGADGAATPGDLIGSEPQRTGFFAFNGIDVQLLTTERTEPAIVSAALTYAAGRGDCVFVGAVPQGFVEAGQAIGYGKSFQGKKVYGALYGPWIKVFDPIGAGAAPFKWIPPVGHILGVYARIEGVRGVWKAPAGDEAKVRGALDVEVQLDDAAHTQHVKEGSVNAVRHVPGSGIVVDSSRSLSTDTRWLYINVRLLFNFVKSSLKTGLRWVRQEPNRDTLWDSVKYGSLQPFLMGLWRQGAFGTGEPAQVFRIIVDQSNNPPESIEQGILNIEVYFYPSRPAEIIRIQVGQLPSGSTASES